MSEESALSRVYDVVIVGAGAAGLGAAARLEGLDILVLERESQVGGRMVSSARRGLWLNLGAHLFPGGESSIGALADAVSVERLPVRGSKTGLYFRRKLYGASRVETYPFLLPLAFRERVALARVGLTIMCHVQRWHSANRLLAETVAERRQRLSTFEARRTFADLLGPAPAPIAAIFNAAARRSAGEATEQTAGAGLSLFAALWVGSRSAEVTNVRGGAGALAEAWRARLGHSVVVSADVTEVVESDALVRVTYRTPAGLTTVCGRSAVVAVQAPVARAIIKDLPAEVDRALASVAYGPFVCLALISDESRPMPWDDLYAIATPDAAFDMIFNHANPVHAATETATSGGSFMCYAGGDRARDLLDVADDEIRERFLTDILAMFPQLRGHITETVVRKWEMGNVFRTPSTQFEDAARWNERAGARVRLAGDYFAHFAGSLEAAAASGAAVATHVLDGLHSTKPNNT